MDYGVFYLEIYIYKDCKLVTTRPFDQTILLFGTKHDINTILMRVIQSKIRRSNSSDFFLNLSLRALVEKTRR